MTDKLMQQGMIERSRVHGWTAQIMQKKNGTLLFKWSTAIIMLLLGMIILIFLIKLMRNTFADIGQSTFFNTASLCRCYRFIYRFVPR